MQNPTGGKRSFVFLLLPEFTLLALSSAIEALRMANAMLGREAYAWKLVSTEGDTVIASSGTGLRCDNTLADERLASMAARPSMVVVVGGLNVQRHSSRKITSWLRDCRHRGITVASLCTGAHALAQAGLLDDRNCVIHWENAPGLAEQFRDTSVGSELFQIDGGIVTCAGGMASFDLMLHLIQQEHGDGIVAAICDRAIVERARNQGERQRPALAARDSLQHHVVASLIERMQAALSDPVPMRELIADLGLTRRQVERLFQHALQISPARYYMRLRLERARLLLQQTAIPIMDVAIASGFSSASHFSKAYRDHYGCSPHVARRSAAVGEGGAANRNLSA